MAQHLDVIKGKVNDFLRKHPNVDEKVQLVTDKTGVEKAYVVLATATLPIFILMAAGSTTLMIDIIGFGYPMYQSMKALETPDTDDDKQWLTYWLIFSLFKITEGVIGVFLQLIPFYFIAKICFLVWCYYPSTRGATTIYNALVKPYIVPALGISEGSTGKKQE